MLTATTTKFLKDLEQHWNAQMELVERGEKQNLKQSKNIVNTD